jgi:tetratricopeptide (TPR) repeat protein
MSCPFAWPTLELQPEDLVGWRYFLARLLRQRLPCQQVRLLPAASAAAAQAEDFPAEWAAALRRVARKGQPVVAGEEPRLFLPLQYENGLYAVAVLAGGDPALYEQFTIKTILERSAGLLDEFLQLKRRGIDPLTGLFSGQLFHEVLAERLTAGSTFHLALLEIYPRIRDAAHAYAYLKRAAGALDAMSGREVPVYHLGGGSFAMLWDEKTERAAREMADLTLYRLQREGMGRVHLGLVRGPQPNRKNLAAFLESAWEAVVQARQRGPLARATWLSPVERESQPFPALPVKVTNRFRDRLRGVEAFSIAALRGAQGMTVDYGGILAQLLTSGQELIEGNGGDCFLLLPDLAGPAARLAVEALQARFNEALPGGIFSAGIAAYPCGPCQRAATGLNARKALHHGTFFGPGSITLFDAVSLNISGDVFYNDGDLSRAVQEYLLGLELDGRNVNLLNSLGVAYIRLAQPGKAAACFERALNVEPENFMALFNLGSTWLTRGRDDLAVGFLERGLAVNRKIFDLVLQLAGLYCRTGQYQRVLELLQDAVTEKAEYLADWEKAAACRYLGEAWRRLGENRKAMTVLQRANRFNPQDSRVLSLLGEVYDAEGEGGDIALALCREAVELDYDKWDNWYRLGLVEYRQGSLREALPALQRSLKLNRAGLEAAELLQKVYEASGKKRLAMNLTDKIVRLRQGRRREN